MLMRHYISCAEIADDFETDRENVHFATSLKSFRELLISKRNEIIAPRDLDSRIFMDSEKNIYFYNGVTECEVNQLLDIVTEKAIAI